MKKIVLLFCLGFISISAVQAVVQPIPVAPDVNAKSYLLYDAVSDKVLAERNSTDRVDPASLTKIMAVYSAAHELKDGNISLKDEVVISEKAWKMEGSRTFLEVNTKVTVETLFMGVIVQSGNDASVALAEHVSGTESVFASLMNLHAQQLGMKDTHFTNATGLPDAEHYTTAQDLVILTKALITEFPEIYQRFKIKEFTYGGIKQNNRNNLLWRDESVDGVKTGHTEAAGYCLVASGQQKGMRLISAVLGSSSKNSRIDASQALLNYGFRFFETHKLYEANQPISEARVWMGETDAVSLGLEKDLIITIPRRRYDDLKATIDVEDKILAPVQTGETRGMIRITLDGKEIANSPLVSLKTVAEGGLIKQLMDKGKLLLK